MADKKPVWTDQLQWTWQLETPVEDSHGGKHDKFLLREPTIGEIDIARKRGSVNGEADNIGQSVMLMQLVSGKPEDVVRNLPYRKFSDMTAYLMHFT